MFLIDKIKFYVKKRQWRKKNIHNQTTLSNSFPFNIVSVGKETYGGLYVLAFNFNSRLIIGNYCSIAPNVSFMLSADHYVDNISSFPYKVKILGENYEAYSKGDIIVDDDVWIGFGATIMSGVHIGQGAVIAAGAVVTKDVAPYAIVGGVPARIIRYRFQSDMIERLLKVDYKKLTKDQIRQHIDDLYTKLQGKEQLDWMPKKDNYKL